VTLPSIRKLTAPDFVCDCFSEVCAIQWIRAGSTLLPSSVEVTVE
jgi:hypothetical protein